jgi:tetratricopeptide (TPR) repeat protein
LRRSGSNAAFAFVPLAAYVGQGLVTVTDPSLDWIAWVSLGVIAAGSTREMRPAWTAGLSRPAIALAFGCAILLIPVALDAQSRIKASEFAGNSEHLLVANRPLDAVTDAGQAVRFDNRRGTYWGRFGSALSAAGSPSAAQSAYADASVREPWQPIWRRDIALQWLQLGNVARAIEALHDAIRIDPHDVISLDLLARLAVNSGNDATAVAYGDRAIELYPARASFYQAPIAAHEGRGEWDVAEREIRVALQYASDPEQPHFHVLLADLLAANGRVAEARAELAWLLANAPNDPEVAALKARLESR